MNFENPAWLIVTPLIVLLIAGMIAFGLRRREALLGQFAAARLLDQLTEKASLKRILIKAGLILLAFTLIGIALARPQYGVDFVERKARGLDIVFALDSSRSMLATDLRPTRLDRAKLAIIDLVDKLESDRIGLVVFAGNAFLQTPPTLDYSAFLENLNSVGPESISRGGSNIGRALREAVKAFPEENNFKVVVLLTDGEDLEKEAVATAREIAGDGIKVYSIGIGTPEGSYLKVRSENGVEEFVRDSSGQPVRSRLDETTLKKISQLTGGSYSRLNGQSLETLYNSVLATLPREERKSELQETRIDRYQWVLLAAVICLVLETLVRRRKTMPASVIAILVLLNSFGPTHSYAEEPTRELTENPVEAIESEKLPEDPRMIYNQAHESLIEGDYTEAMNLYKTAIEQSDDIELERDGFYNMAHASNQLGEEALQAQDFETAIERWKQAEAFFESANELDPTDTASLEDAQQMAARRKALEEFLKQQKSQEQQQQNDTDSDQNQQKQDSKTESDKNKQENSQPSSDDSSDGQNDSQSGENPSEQQQSNESASEQEQSGSQENASDSESSSSKDNQSNESSQSRKGEEESSENPDSENSSNSSAESTANPADDMQQQDEAAVSNKDNETTSETETGEAVPETSDKTDSSEGTQKAATIPESADISEVQLLLDSLRNKERLLPFEEPSDNRGQKRDTRDW